MRTEILLSTEDGACTSRRLDGPMTVGGSQADGVYAEGLPPAALHIEPRPAGLVMLATVPGLRVAGIPIPPGTRRLLRPGQRAALRRFSLALPKPAADTPTRVGAAALLRERGAPPEPAGPTLVILSGGDAGERVPIGAELIVGRGRGAALRVRDPSASRRHARLRIGPAGGATVEDLGAKNPLRINGVAVDRGPVPLRRGDRVTIGETDLVFDDGALPLDEPGPAPPRRVRRRRRLRGRPALAIRPLAAALMLAASAAALAAASSCGT